MRGRKPKTDKNPFEKFRLERNPEAVHKTSGIMEDPSLNLGDDSKTKGIMSKDANLDSYSEHLEKTAEGQLLEKNFEIEELNVKLSAANSENARLKEVIERLKTKIHDLETKIEHISEESIEPFKARVSELEKQNRELMVNNGKIMSDLDAKNKIVMEKQSQLDAIKHSYTQTGYRNMGMKGSGFVQSMNGYQDWN